MAAPKNQVLRLTIEKHKARLSSEFTRCRIRQGFGSVEAFRDHVNDQFSTSSNGTDEFHKHPRWVRVNRLKTSLDDQLKTTLRGYRRVERLEEVLRASAKEKVFAVDEHIPDLLAFPTGHDFTKADAYLKGELILQDKASCFPAYLLDPRRQHGDVIDTCAAPGNKTTHLAALLHEALDENDRRKVFAFERNPYRSTVLKKMVARAGGDKIIEVFGSTDFLTVKPDDPRFANVQALLLDPSCSGTGIVGRDEEPVMQLPELTGTSVSTASKKRKRNTKEQKAPQVEKAEDVAENEAVDEDKSLEERLRFLSDFQVQLIQHGMQFPKAKRITYSTCSIHAEENEHVVLRALASQVAQERGWRILLRKEQPIGMQQWAIRGVKEACEPGHGASATHLRLPEHHTPVEIAGACIRCEKGTKEGTMGFFVATFMRNDSGRIAVNGSGVVEPEATESASGKRADNDESAVEAYEDEWKGLSDEE